MGRTSTTQYAIWMTGCTPACWDIKQNGAPTVENPTHYVMADGKSLEVGGPNEHISRSLGHIPYPDRAVIRHNNRPARWWSSGAPVHSRCGVKSESLRPASMGRFAYGPSCV
jgi:hypothetical protein